MKRLLILIVGLAGLVVFFLYLQGMLGVHRVEPGMSVILPEPVIQGTPFEVKKVAVQEPEKVVGTVTARQTTQISAKIPAHVKSIQVKAGTVIAKGELLATLDDRDIQARMDQVKAQLRSAEAQLEQAKTNFRRQENLLKTGATTQAQFDSAKTGLDQAEAGVKQVQDGIRELEVMASFTRVAAPYAGVVVEKLVDVGTLVAPGIPLFTIQTSEGVRFEVSIPTALTGTIEAGQELEVVMDTTGEKFKGTVAEIVPSADPRSRSFLVRVALPGSQDLRPGMYGRLLLPGSTVQAIVVPPGAVLQVGQLDMVYVKTAEGIQSRMVRVGKRYDQGVAVLSGLNPGETVMVPREEGVQ